MILRSRILLALAAVLASVLIQTTVFRELRPLGVAPDLVILTVIAAARWLDPQPAVLLGFTGGIVIDLLGAQVLGLRALAYTVVAYLTVRLRDRMEVNVLTCGVILVGLVAVGVLIVGVVGTLVQEQTVTSTGFARALLLVPLYDLVLGIAVLPLMTRLLRLSEREKALL
ncbi:MAG TPA: rod shape-determining protein MreD [Acidimicrobiia bacterium]|jgi:rod shape-determining protein MreD|nr:rod shape-determining protein MreD [Acidimicrobiia bacterium]